MILAYNDKEINLKECKSFFRRLKGFMFKRNINYALFFDKCNSIHTFFMKENIDIIMCDKNNNIMFYYRNIGKRKIIWPKRGVTRVFETPSCFFDIELDKGKKMIIK